MPLIVAEQLETSNEALAEPQTEAAFALFESFGHSCRGSIHEAKTAYYRLLKTHHPDHHRTDVEGANEMTQQIIKAWEKIKMHFEKPEREEPERPIEQPNRKKQRAMALVRPKCKLAQAESIIQTLGLGGSTEDLAKKGKGGRKAKDPNHVGTRYIYVVATKAKTTKYKAFYQGISERADKNLQIDCGTYLTEEEAAIAVALCKKRLADIGANTFADIMNMLKFNAEAFGKDIQDEVEKAIKSVQGETPLLTDTTDASGSE